MFNILFYQPIANAMVLLYNTIALRDLGIAIILVTAVVRLILYPFFHKMFHQQALAAKMRPELQKIQKEFKNDKERQTKELMALYQKYRVNPFYPVLFMLIQLPIAFALFKVFTKGIETKFAGLLYPFITSPESISSLSLNFVDLSKRNIILIIIAAGLQYWQARTGSQAAAADPEQKKMSDMMSIVGVVLIAVVLWTVPSAVALYFIVTSAFSIYQQMSCNKQVENEEFKGANR